MVRHGRTVGATFSEEAINAYFRYVKVRRMGVDSLSVAVAEGRIRMRMIQAAKPVHIGSKTWTPRLSYDFLMTPVDGKLNVRKVSLGRFPLFGPLKRPVVKKVHTLFLAQPEWASFKYVTDITAKEGKLFVEASRK
jgi:hypothetical protein